LDHLCQKVPDARWEREESSQPHEACLLKLDITKARSKLGWSPRWSLATGLDKTLEWHQAWRDGRSMTDVSTKQIEEYQSL